MSTKAIERFLQTAYDDAHLAALLAHAEDGKLAFNSCCCLLGASNAKHALQLSRAYGAERPPLDEYVNHHIEVRQTVEGADEAEKEFSAFADSDDAASDAIRCAKMIPLIKAEMERREALNVPEAGRGDSVDTEIARGLEAEKVFA